MKKILLMSLMSLMSLISPINVLAAATASLTLSPGSGNINVNETLNVNLVLNTGGQSASGVDVYLKFNPSYVQVKDVAIQNLFSGADNSKTINNQTGSVYLGSSVVSSVNNFNGSGTLAIITLQGKAGGTAALTIQCTPGSTSDSNVMAGNSDILDCTKNNAGSYVVAGSDGGSGDSGTSGYGTTGTDSYGSGTGSGGGMAGAEPVGYGSPAPVSGATENLFILLFFGASFLLFSGLLRRAFSFLTSS